MRLITIIASNEESAQEKLKDAAGSSTAHILRSARTDSFEYRREGKLKVTDKAANVEFDIIGGYVLIATIG